MGGQEVKRTHELTRGSYLEAICQVLERQARAKPSCAKDMEISPWSHYQPKAQTSVHQGHTLGPWSRVVRAVLQPLCNQY